MKDSFKVELTGQELTDLIMALGIAYERIGKNDYGSKNRFTKLRIYYESIINKNLIEKRKFGKLRTKLYEIFYPNDYKS